MAAGFTNACDASGSLANTGLMCFAKSVHDGGKRDQLEASTLKCLIDVLEQKGRFPWTWQLLFCWLGQNLSQNSPKIRPIQ
jgi:hypothetical protein